jgi:hypothetical protein
MPDAVVTTVTKAVVAELAGASFSQAFTPERSYADWARPLETDAVDIEDQLFVDVVGHQTEQVTQAVTRGSEPKLKYVVQVDVAVRKKYGMNLQTAGRVKIEEVDSLCLLVQEIHEWFLLKRLPEETGVVWNAPATVLLNPSRDHLKDMKQFTGIVRLSLAAFKEAEVA